MCVGGGRAKEREGGRRRMREARGTFKKEEEGVVRKRKCYSKYTQHTQHTHTAPLSLLLSPPSLPLSRRTDRREGTHQSNEVSSIVWTAAAGTVSPSVVKAVSKAIR